MNIGNLLKRLQKLEATTSNKFVTFTMPDGTFQRLRHKVFRTACTDAIYGIQSPEAAIVSEAISCNETSNSSLLELLHMVIK